ncbi:MAG TPA: hypothetical protein VFG47_04300 [Geminicoccaceae bacterium]|nr:hypothetical protein [Geminicoccaceae bacterium]
MDAVRAIRSAVAAPVGARQPLRWRPGVLPRAAVAVLPLAVGCWPAATARAAEESWQGQLVATVVRFEALPVGDAEGHAVGLFENRGAMLHDDGRVAQFTARGTFEFARGVAGSRGYVVLDYEDGARAFAEVEGTYDATGRPATDRGTFTFTGGEEGLRGLGGEGTFSGRALAPVDDGGTLYYTGTATATLPD